MADETDVFDLGLDGAAGGVPDCNHVFHWGCRRGEVGVLAVVVEGGVIEAQKPVLDEDQSSEEGRDDAEGRLDNRGQRLAEVLICNVELLDGN